MDIDIPDYFMQNILRVFGAAGQDWLERLPDILAHCCDHWKLTLLSPVTGLSSNYVVYATRTYGDKVVLKVGVPQRELVTEITALQLYRSRKIIRCLDADLSLGAMLLERVLPGRMLTSLPDNAQQTYVVAGIIKELPIPCTSESNLPTFAEWLERAFIRLRRSYGAGCGPLGSTMVTQAERAFSAIQACKEPMKLLHGDLHHENILYDEHLGWVAIDPKGVIGDSVLEVGRFIHNKLPCNISYSELEKYITDRVDILSSELTIPHEKIYCSAFIDIILSLSWSLEDCSPGAEWEHRLNVAQLLSTHVMV